MDPKELSYLSAVAKYKGLNKASEAVFITPSALSKYISNLESKYQVKLFDRVGKQFILTYAGERYIYWLEQQVDIQYRLENEMLDIAESRAGRFKVGIPTNFTTQYFIANVASEFQKKYSNVEIDIIEKPGHDICKLQAENRLDFSLAAIDTMITNINYQYLFNEEVGIVTKKEDPLVKKAVHKSGFKYPWIPIELLKNRPFAFPEEQQQMNSIIANIIYDSDIHIIPRIRTSTVISQMDCVLHGNTLAIMPETLVQLGEHSEHLTMLSFGNRPVSRKWMLFYHKDHFISSLLKELMDLTIKKYNNIL